MLCYKYFTTTKKKGKKKASGFHSGQCFPLHKEETEIQLGGAHRGALLMFIYKLMAKWLFLVYFHTFNCILHIYSKGRVFGSTQKVYISPKR